MKNAAVLHAEASVGSLTSEVMRRDVRSDDADRPLPGTRGSRLQREAVCGEAADNPCRARDAFWSCDDSENTLIAHRASAVMAEHDKGVEKPKRRGCHNEHVDRRNVGQVVVQEGAPGRGGSLWAATAGISRP